DARAVCDVRDDNGIWTAAWPAGLLRRAMLEVGRRLTERRQLLEPSHAVEVTVAELLGLLVGAAQAPAATEVAERRRLRLAPAYNVVLGCAAAVVTEEGGQLSHAAVIAREFGVPAVIGAAEALARIPDGSLVEVDPAEGRIRVLDDSPRR